MPAVLTGDRCYTFCTAVAGSRFGPQAAMGVFIGLFVATVILAKAAAEAKAERQIRKYGHALARELEELNHVGCGSYLLLLSVALVFFLIGSIVGHVTSSQALGWQFGLASLFVSVPSLICRRIYLRIKAKQEFKRLNPHWSETKGHDPDVSQPYGPG